MWKNYPHSQDNEHIHHLNFSYPLAIPSFPTSPPGNRWCAFCHYPLYLLEFYPDGIIRCVRTYSFSPVQPRGKKVQWMCPWEFALLNSEVRVTAQELSWLLCLLVVSPWSDFSWTEARVSCYQSDWRQEVVVDFPEIIGTTAFSPWGFLRLWLR